MMLPKYSSLRCRSKGLLNNFDEAYADQFSKVLNAQLMDLDAEMKVMKDNMAADGLKPEIPESRKNSGTQ